MLVYEEAWNYQGYLDSDLLEYKIKQEKIFDKIELSRDTIEKIKSIKNTVNILMFAEIYCPDCRAVVPFIEKFARLNDNINVNIFPRVGNESYIALHSKSTKIPLILVEDIQKGDEEFITIFEERLPKVVEAFDKAHTEEDRENIVYEFRRGLFNRELEKYLLTKILEIIDKD